MTPRDGAPIVALLSGVARRLVLRRALVAAAAALGVAVLVGLAVWWRGGAASWWAVGTIAASLLSALVAAWRGPHGVVAAADAVERADPTLRNVLRTAAELVSGTGEPSYGEALVLARAAHSVAGQAAARYLPLAKPAALLAAAASCALLMGWGLRGAEGVSLPRLVGVGAGASIDMLEVTVTPPAYTGRAPRVERDPARLDVLAGSRLALRVRGTAGAMTVETAETTLPLDMRSPTEFTATLPAEGDGFLAITAVAAGGADTVRRLIAVGVTADRPPTVRVTAPGRDLLLQDGRTTITLGVEAEDDLALASLRLRYTVVSGSGEQFTFREGEVPLTLQRASPVAWRGSATWPLVALGLEPGDMVVYRAVAADGRPGASAVESDAWIVEVRSPGALAVDGFAIDPDEERYAISQQMVILKTERLLARRATMSAEAFADSAAELAAEQRKVRSEFVFMMGGEVEDGHHGEVSQTELNEVAEAEGEDELAAGRMLNAGRMAIVRGIRAMSQAASLLDVTSVTEALAEERRALKEINEAFSRSRIILRALTVPERLDTTRRLTGSLTEALGARRSVAVAVPAARQEALGALLAAVGRLAATADAPATRATAAEGLAERALRIDPAAPALQRSSTALLEAAAAWRRRDDAGARAALTRAGTALVAEATPAAARAPARGAQSRLDRLRGALGTPPARAEGRP